MIELTPVIETMENRLMRAWVARDAKELKSLVAPNFVLLVGSMPATILDNRSWREAATTRYLCTSYRFGDVYVRDFGRLALFASQLDLTATMDGHDWSGRLWVTDLWRRGRVSRGWRIVERVLSRPEDKREIAGAIRSLQLWR